MSYELIITEKPQSANKIATALADSKPVKKSINKVPYYEITHDGKDIVVGCAVGHLYSVGTKGSGKWTYPVFDIEWQPISKLQKKAAFASKYITALRKIAKDAAMVTVACDYDIEGEVIGYNILRFICKKKDGNRMKFSTLTAEDLKNSYMKKSPTIDWGQANAGITRHELDWYYGINMSRALMQAIKSAGAFKILSAGRVQGPALKTLVEKEKEIKAFVPEPFWQIELVGEAKRQPLTALHEKDKFFSEEESQKVWTKVKDQKNGTISDIKRNRFRQNPPYPFDLTTLQTEAYRSLRIVPKKALEIAQNLYTKGLISYPRTSSQKLPKNIGYQKILNKLKSQSEYRELAGKLLKRGTLKPNEGKKEDPAHPAIYPTGNSSSLEGWELRIYDLVVRRFMATFADSAVRESAQIRIDVNSEPFIAKGTITIEKGWHEFYGRHVKLDETVLPNVVKDDWVDIKKMDLLAKETQPPKRYTPASIIKELEKRNLGTKATRAQIIENLFSRGYITGTSIEVTALGMLTCETLDKHVPMMLDEELTRHFEDEMEKIRQRDMKPQQVLKEAQEKLTLILKQVKKDEKQIGEELKSAFYKTREEMSFIGKCPKCGKNLEIRKGKFGRFIACSGYPECKNTFNLPNTGIIKATEQVCEHCKNPVISVRRKRSKPQVVCINNECPSKKNESNGKNGPKNGEKVDKLCPKCQSPLVLRKSIYGEFYGCSKFPKCRYTERIEGDDSKENDTKRVDTKKRSEKSKV